MYCKKCGKKIDNNNASFCPKCGAEFSKPDERGKNIEILNKNTRIVVTKNWRYFVSCRFRDYFLKGFLSGLATLIVTIILGQIDGSGEGSFTPFYYFLILYAMLFYWFCITIGFIYGYFKFQSVIKEHYNETEKKIKNGYEKSIKTIMIVAFVSLMVWGAYSVNNNDLPKSTDETGATSVNEQQCNEQNTIEDVKASTHLIGQFDNKDNFLAHGSGFAINDPVTSGLVMTNYHVIEGAKTIKVWIGYDGKEWMNASVFAGYPDQDIAILKVDYNFYWKVDLQDSDKLKPAETLYAIGWPNNPTGEATITKGIFSRRINEDGYDIIQTDASINPGNSGGPLINSCGVVGMNTAKLFWSDDYSPAEGTGYALSSKYINSITIKK